MKNIKLFVVVLLTLSLQNIAYAEEPIAQLEKFFSGIQIIFR